MYLLTYERRDGYPVKLVFDSNEEALYSGSQYAIENNQSEYTISSYPYPYSPYIDNLFSYKINI
jgi:hypothetical protein